MKVIIHPWLMCCQSHSCLSCSLESISQYLHAYLLLFPCIIPPFSLLVVFLVAVVMTFQNWGVYPWRKMKTIFLAFYIQDLIHTMPEEFENGGFPLEMRQMFSVCMYWAWEVWKRTNPLPLCICDWAKLE